MKVDGGAELTWVRCNGLRSILSRLNKWTLFDIVVCVCCDAGESLSGRDGIRHLPLMCRVNFAIVKTASDAWLCDCWERYSILQIRDARRISMRA